MCIFCFLKQKTVFQKQNQTSPLFAVYLQCCSQLIGAYAVGHIFCSANHATALGALFPAYHKQYARLITINQIL